MRDRARATSRRAFGANVARSPRRARPVRGSSARIWEGAQDKLSGGEAAPGPQLVASVIADALESDRAQLRWPVGSDADDGRGRRAKGMSYDDFEAAMREVLQLDW